MGTEKGKKLKKPKKKTIIILTAVFVILAGGAAFLFWRFHRQPEEAGFPFGDRQGSMGNMGSMGKMEIAQGMVAASGVTSAGIIEEGFPVENLTAVLVIEEVYLFSESAVTEGDRVLKLSEESVTEARKELNQTLKEAELAYRAGAIEYEKSMITIEYERDSTLLKGKQAREVYEETLARLQDNVDSAREALADAKEQIAEYQSFVNDGSYREYFELDKYQSIYDTNLEAIIIKLDEWNISWLQITGQGGGMGNSNPAGSGGREGASGLNLTSFDEPDIQDAPNPEGSDETEDSDNSNPEDSNGMETSDTPNPEDPNGTEDSDNSNPEDSSNSEDTGELEGDAVHIATVDEIQTLSSLYRILEENLKDLEQAQSDYANAVANAGFQLQTLELQLPGLEQAYEKAKENYELQTLQVKLTYETAMANAESAESRYEAAVSKAESDYKSLKGDWKDAGENLELFERCVGDGYFYAPGSGTVLRMMVRAGQGLTSQGVLFWYSNPEKMTVTVSVDQADISGIVMGDSVSIQSSEYGSFAGVVMEVNPISNSGSRTNVSYDVTVAFMGDTCELPANQSVTVFFGMGERKPWVSASPQNTEGEAGWLDGGMQRKTQVPQDAGNPQRNGEQTEAGTE